MRVIAGVAGGRRLRVPKGTDVRPTADRVREALFSSLADQVPGAVALDLYAGAGSLGIEALSRGADRVVFVEQARAALDALRANLETTGLGSAAVVAPTTVERFCADPDHGPFDLVFADPPYAEPLAAVWSALAGLHGAGALAPGALVVVERDRRDPSLGTQPPAFLALERTRPYGDTVLVYLRAAPGPAGEEERWA
jgi:16S rRNA (guanine966-N2)-methyltransferase